MMRRDNLGGKVMGECGPPSLKLWWMERDDEENIMTRISGMTGNISMDANGAVSRVILSQWLIIRVLSNSVFLNIRICM